ncbi:MAG: hypothetical protein HY903_09195 [Deltaproteobacteria bacterium]|nr:hypothetical protein [Deltaproteobacteria bacterium]
MGSDTVNNNLSSSATGTVTKEPDGAPNGDPIQGPPAPENVFEGLRKEGLNLRPSMPVGAVPAEPGGGTPVSRQAASASRAERLLAAQADGLAHFKRVIQAYVRTNPELKPTRMQRCFPQLWKKEPVLRIPIAGVGGDGNDERAWAHMVLAEDQIKDWLRNEGLPAWQGIAWYRAGVPAFTSTPRWGGETLFLILTRKGLAWNMPMFDQRSARARAYDYFEELRRGLTYQHR